MTNLIYLICLGIGEGETAPDVHVDMCQMCIDSIRDQGEYDGEIALVCDRDEFDRVDFVINLDASWVIDSLNDIGLLRFKVLEPLDIDRYDSIMFLDNDVLALDDINPIFDLPDRNIVISEEYPISQMYVSTGSWNNMPFLEDEYVKDAKNNPRINTGIFCMDSDIYLDYCEKIFEYTKECIAFYDYNGVEQLPVNAMIIRGELDYQPVPHSWVEFPIASKNVGPSMVTRYTKLMHYVGNIPAQEKRNRMEEDKRLIENNNLEDLERRYRYEG